MKIIKSEKYKGTMTDEEKQKANDLCKSDKNFLDFIKNKKKDKEEK